MDGQRVGRYEVLTRLTKGGMAELSLASTAGPGGFRKFVVLKRILPEAAGDENFVKMFLDEARVTGAFSHPAICQVFELGNDKEVGLFVAMEFIAGQDLNQVVAACARQQAVLPVGFSASVVHDCALALHYAHTFKLPNGEDRSVIHRDVAQKNIMVTYDGQVKLLDFGIAKAKGALARTRAGTVKGTAGYMSPEQVRGETIDPRSDVFGLGVVLWEMVTGRRLFSAETELLELKMILSEPIVPPHEVEPSVPRELSDVAMKALERDLALRFKSAREMARALSQTCGHLLFDAEERAGFMKERFAEKIESAQRLFDVAGSKDDSEVDRAVEDFRRSSQHEREKEEPPPSRKPAISANKLKAARAGQVSAKSLKKVKAQAFKRTDESTDFDGKPLGARQAQGAEQKAMTEAMVPTYEPSSSSKMWPILAVVMALGVGGVVWKVMQSSPDPQPRPVVGELPGTDLPGTELPGTDLPGTDSPPVGNPPKNNVDSPNVANPKKDPDVVRPQVPKQQGEITLALIPEATVTKGSTKLGQGSLISFSLPVGTHLVTIRGEDGVRRKLSLQVGAGKNKPQRYRLEDLPPE
jgi:serine/threonine-protein kinase